MKAYCIAIVGVAILWPIGVSAQFRAAPIVADEADARNLSAAVQVSFGLLGPYALRSGMDSVGIRVGQGVEHVFDYEGPGESRRQLSRLDWDLQDVVMGGGRVSLRGFRRLTLNGGVWLALTEGTGEMEDFDWLEADNPDWTHYSLSDVDVTQGYLVDINAAWDVVRWQGLTGSVLAGYKQDGWRWEDRGVFLLYPEYNYVPVALFGEAMITYQQVFRMPYLGGNVDWRFGALPFAGGRVALGLSAAVTYSPHLWARAWDHHIDRELHFKDSFEGGDMWGGGLAVRVDVALPHGRSAFAALALDYQRIGLIMGDADVYDAATGETARFQDAAGIENEYLVVSLGGGFRF